MRSSILVLVALFTATAAAQDKPDFSGEWTLLTASAGASSNVPVALKVRQFVDPRPGTIVAVERRFVRATRSDTYRIGVQGGTVNGNPGGVNGVTGTSLSCQWEGTRLVIETSTSHVVQTSSTTHREEWRLDEGGQLVIVVTDRAGDGESTTMTLTYQRRLVR